MTDLDEMIKYYEEETKTYKNLSNYNFKSIDCTEYINRYSQLVKLLKELKAYKEGRVGCEFCKHNFRKENERPCSLCQHNFMDMFEEGDGNDSN